MNVTCPIGGASISRIQGRIGPLPLPGRLPDSRIDSDQVLLTRIGLQIPRGISFEDWQRAGRDLSSMVDLSLWCLGDWLIYGKENYSDRYIQAIRAVGLQYQTLRNYAWVSRRFERDRRRTKLSFQHHAEVASLSADEQDLWLDRAERETWTTKQLRDRVRGARDINEKTRDRALVFPRIQVEDMRLLWWRRAAERLGVELHDWIPAVLDHAAEQTLSSIK